MPDPNDLATNTHTPTPANDDDLRPSGETATTGADEAETDEPAKPPASDQPDRMDCS